MMLAPSVALASYSWAASTCGESHRPLFALGYAVKSKLIVQQSCARYLACKSRHSFDSAVAADPGDVVGRLAPSSVAAKSAEYST